MIYSSDTLLLYMEINIHHCIIVNKSSQYGTNGKNQGDQDGTFT